MEHQSRIEMDVIGLSVSLEEAQFYKATVLVSNKKLELKFIWKSLS